MEYETQFCIARKGPQKGLSRNILHILLYRIYALLMFIVPLPFMGDYTEISQIGLFLDLHK